MVGRDNILVHNITKCYYICDTEGVAWNSKIEMWVGIPMVRNPWNKGMDGGKNMGEALNAYTFGVRIECLIAILRQNAYMHEQVTKEFA